MNSNGFVMTPGPTEIPVSVLQAMLRPATSPGDPDFLKVMDETSDLLQEILGTRGNVVFFSGSGRVAVESAVTSIIDPGDRVLTLNTGVFGKWIGETVERAQGENVELKTNWRRAVEPEAVRAKLAAEKDIKAVVMVHNETSTGVRNPVGEIGKIVKDYGALFIVDTVSSAGGDMVTTDDWLADMNATGCYKCMNCPPGIAVVAVREKAWEAMAGKRVRRSFAFDLYKWLENWIPAERGGMLKWGKRHDVVEPMPQLTFAFNQSLKVILQEGLANRIAKNTLAGKAVRAAVRAMGLELYAMEESEASNTLTVILNNTGIPGDEITGAMRRDYGMLLAGGLEDVAGKIIRIAHMSLTSDEMYIMRAIEALERTLMGLGWRMPPHAGADAAAAVFRGLAQRRG